MNSIKLSSMVRTEEEECCSVSLLLLPDYRLASARQLVALLTQGSVTVDRADLPELASLMQSLRLSLRIVVEGQSDLQALSMKEENMLTFGMVKLAKVITTGGQAAKTAVDLTEAPSVEGENIQGSSCEHSDQEGFEDAGSRPDSPDSTCSGQQEAATSITSVKRTSVKMISVKKTSVKRQRPAGQNSVTPTIAEILAEHGIDIGQHIQRSDLDQAYCCLREGCAKTYKARADAVSHVFKHLNLLPYRCSQCDMSFNGRGDLKYHRVTHNKRFACDACAKAFSTRQKLRVHTRTHTGEKPFVCDTCGFCTSLARNLNVHKNIHTRSRPYSCIVAGCAEMFTFPSQLRRHRELQHGENWENMECDICSHRSKTTADLGKAFSRDKRSLS